MTEINDFSRSKLAQVESLVKHIEQTANFEEVVKATEEGKLYKVQQKKVWQKIAGIFIASGEDFLGTAKNNKAG
jgi:hypothetical protein